MASHNLTVGTFNIQNFGYIKGRGHYHLPAALDYLLEQTPTPPDILALPEANLGLIDGQRAIRRTVVGTLAPHLDSGWYEPLFTMRSPTGMRNHLHLLLVNTAKVRPLEWYDPQAPDAGKRYYGFAVCDIFGHEVKICCEHWSGGEGRQEFDKAACRVSNQGGKDKKALLLGDFNADSSWEREHHHSLDWYTHCEQRAELDKLLEKGWLNPATGKWEIDTRQLDRLRGIYGFHDMGEEASNPTPTAGSGLRIDRILRSSGFDATVTDYQVRTPPREVSDHAYVFGTYRLNW